MTSTTLDTPTRSRLRPTMPCATCDALLWWHASYVLGVSRCQSCRRAAPAPRRAARAPRLCEVCHHQPVSTKRARTCGPLCANVLRGSQDTASRRAKDRTRCARRRARLAEQIVETVDPDVVFERDRWRCHLCGKRIDRTLSGRHRLGPTLDHLIPLAAGGEHSYANVAAAHRACNSGRVHRRDDAVQLALVG